MYLSEQAAQESAKMIVAFKMDSSAPITEADLEKAFIDGVKWERERMTSLINAITDAQNAANSIVNVARLTFDEPLNSPKNIGY